MHYFLSKIAKFEKTTNQCTMSNSEPSKKPIQIWVIVLAALIIVVGLWLANYFLIANDPKRGTLGDMYGVVNSLFSGLAFAGIIITIYLQRDELKLQRQELKDTREEFHIQNATLRSQRFENTFFNMLSLHHDIVNNTDWVIEEIQAEARTSGFLVTGRQRKIVRNTIKGRDVFELHYSELKNQLRDFEDQTYISDNYGKEYEKYKNDFDHYFRNLYRIIKLVDTTQFTDDPNSKKEFQEKYKYTSIVRSQLSTFELLWLFYNCLSRNGIHSFKPLVEKYTLFKNLRFEELASGKHINLYERSAFEKVHNENFKV